MSRKMLSAICKECGIGYMSISYKVINGLTSFCGNLCKSIAGGKANKNKVNLPRGPSHHLWKGGKENRKLKQALYRKIFSNRVQSRRAVSKALLSGKIKKIPCEICGNIKSEAHHEDYEKPLEVIWLCKIHHREADRRLGWGPKDFLKKEIK